MHLDPPTLMANAANSNTTATIGIGAGILYTRRIPIAIRETLCMPLRSLDVLLAKPRKKKPGFRRELPAGASRRREWRRRGSPCAVAHPTTPRGSRLHKILDKYGRLEVQEQFS